MRTSLAALGFFPKTRLRHWPGLALYLMGWAAFKLGGFRLFRERTLRFKDFVVVADVEGRSGLAFLHEILVKRIYDLAPLRPDKPGRDFRRRRQLRFLCPDALRERPTIEGSLF